MAITHNQLIAPKLLTASATAQYTVGTGIKTQVRALSVANTTAAPVALKLWLGSGATDANLVENKTLAAGETYLCIYAINQILRAGDKITAQGLGLSLMASGAEIS